MPESDFEDPMQRECRGTRVSVIAMAVLGAIVLAANWWLVSSAAADHSWGALGIAFMIGPLTNLAILAIACLAIPFLRMAAAGGSVGPYILLAIALPIAAAGVDFLLIMLMDLHGC